MVDLLKMFVDADVAMAMVSVILTIMVVGAVQILKRFLPSPAPGDPMKPENKWDIVEWLAFVPLISAFLFGMILSIVFDPHKGQAFIGKLRDGIETGAYAVAAWEVYSNVLKPVIDKLIGK